MKQFSVNNMQLLMIVLIDEAIVYQQHAIFDDCFDWWDNSVDTFVVAYTPAPSSSLTPTHMWGDSGGYYTGGPLFEFPN